MIVERLKFYCKKKGVSFAEFERESGVGERTASRWDTNSPNINKVIQAAHYFGITVSELIGETETPTPEGGRYLNNVMGFLLSLPKDRLRGILLALGAPADVLAELDQQSQMQ